MAQYTIGHEALVQAVRYALNDSEVYGEDRLQACLTSIAAKKKACTISLAARGAEMLAMEKRLEDFAIGGDEFNYTETAFNNALTEVLDYATLWAQAE